MECLRASEQTLLLRPWRLLLHAPTRRRIQPSDLLRIRTPELPNRSILPMHLHRRKHPPRMERRQRKRSNDNHDTLQDDKVRLILHDGVAPPARHLRDTEHASRPDGDVGEGEAGDEELEASRGKGFDG